MTSTFAAVTVRDDLLDPHGAEAIEPGQTRTVEMGRVRGGDVNELRVVAAVFSNGDTEGPAEWIERILEGRRRTLAEIAETAPLVEDAIRTGETRTAVLRKLEDRLAAIRAKVQFDALAAPASPSRGTGPRVLQRTVRLLENLRVAGGDPTDSEALRSVLRILEEWKARLESSSPKLR